MAEVDSVELAIELRQIAHDGPLPRTAWLPAMVARHPSGECDAARFRMRPSSRHLGMLGHGVRAGVSGQRMLIGDDSPPILDREIVLPSRHGRAGRLERFDSPAFADAPEPVGIGHLRDHRLVSQGGRFHREPRGGWSIAGAVAAMADGALHLVNRPASPTYF